MFRNDSILAMNAVGFRDIESKVPVQVSDYFHIGSAPNPLLLFWPGNLLKMVFWNGIPVFLSYFLN